MDFFDDLANLQAGKSPPDGSVESSSPEVVEKEPPLFIFSDNDNVKRFKPECNEQLTPEFIALSVGVETEELRGVNKDSRCWFVDKSGERFIPSLPRIQDLSGEYIIMVRKLQKAQQTPASAAAHTGVESLLVSPSPAKAEADVAEVKVPNGKRGDTIITVMQQQLLSHATLHADAQLKKYGWGAARQACYVACVSAILTKTSEANSKYSCKRQKEPGIAAENVVQGIEAMFPSLKAITLPVKNKGSKPEGLVDEAREVSRTSIGRAVRSVFFPNKPGVKSRTQGVVDKDKYYPDVPDGQTKEEFAEQHSITLHSDGRIYAYQGIRWRDPRNANDKAAIISSFNSSPLAGWMAGPDGLSSLFAKLEQYCLQTARTIPPAGKVAKRLDGALKDVVEEQGIGASKRRRTNNDDMSEHGRPALQDITQRTANEKNSTPTRTRPGSDGAASGAADDAPIVVTPPPPGSDGAASGAADAPIVVTPSPCAASDDGARV